MKKGTVIVLATTALIGTLTTGMLAGNLFKDEQDFGEKNSAWTKVNPEGEKLMKEEQREKSEKGEGEKVPAGTGLPLLKGTYRCWSFNVAGSGQKCTSPPIVLNNDGTYSMSSEKGKYKISGNKIVLSESKIRGPGTFKEGQKQIVFNYTYNGQVTTVTYLNYDDPENNEGKMVSVKLIVIFPDGDDRAKWLSSISLAPYEGLDVYDSLSQNDGEHKIVAEYREVESGKKYKVMAGLTEILGEVDLSNAKGHAEFTVYVNAAKEIEDIPKAKTEVPPAPVVKPKSKPKAVVKPAPEPAPEPAPIPVPAAKPKPAPVQEPEPKVEPKPAPKPVPQPEPEPVPAYAPPEPEPESSPYAGKPCDPNVPHYSQPGCVD